jgi:hypothetical protein
MNDQEIEYNNSDPVTYQILKNILIKSLGASSINFNPIYPFKLNAGIIIFNNFFIF